MLLLLLPMLRPVD